RKGADAACAQRNDRQPPIIRSTDRLLLGDGRFGGNRSQRREGEVKRRSGAFLAFDPDRSAVSLHDLPGDVETESQPAIVGRRDLAPAVEALEDLPDLVRGNAYSKIANRGDDLFVLGLHVDRDFAAI